MLTKRLNLAIVTAALAFSVGNNAHATLNISDAPLFLVTPVKPALVVALDDSGSMDGEVIFPSNDGAAWWNTQEQSYIGQGFDASEGEDVDIEGTINFNWNGGANRRWKKYVYLFPNGTGGNQGRRRYGDGDSDHFAIPPLPEYAWTRSPSYNAQYFRPDSTYPPYPDTDDRTFENIDPKNAPWDPIYGGENFDVDLTETIESDENNWLFRLYYGTVVPAGTMIDPSYGTDQGGACDSFGTGGSNDWRVTTTDIKIDADNNRGYCDAGIEYFPATFWIRADDVAEMVPDDFGFIDANRLTSVSGPVPGDDDRALMFGYEIKPENFTSSGAYRKAIQSFANWFSYYRKRSMTLRGALGRAFAPFNFLRVGNFTINNRETVDMIDLENPTDKSEFLNWAYELRGTGGTPNRQAVLHMGRQFERTGANAPIIEACQRNFGMLFTDGYANTWTGSGVGNTDSGEPAPIGDAYSDTMADIAYSFYKENLRDDLEAGRVPVSPVCSEASPPLSQNCNADPHMNFFGVSMGGDGLIYNVDQDATNDPWNNPPSWIDANADRSPSAIDDMWHATLNTRGEMFSARSPDEVAGAIEAVLSTIAAQTTPVGVSANSTRLDAGSLVFQSSVNSADWSGDVRAFEPGETVADWTATEALPDAGDRNIYTWDPSINAGVPFDIGVSGDVRSRILADVPADFLGNVFPDPANIVIDYVRGSQAFEDPGPLRERQKLIGDIVNSVPVYVGQRNEGWARIDSGYNDYLDNVKSNRPETLYVGANAGMMHAFDAETGRELFAFVPASVHKNLPDLVDPDYNHEFYVDGQFAVSDAQGPSGWTSALVGTLGAGGRGVFALDIGEPDAFNPAADVLWEFTSDDDPDIGFTFGDPVISRLENGTWVAVFANGYNSDSEQAFLYVVDLFEGPDTNGDPLFKIPLGATGDNGLSGVAGFLDPETRNHLSRVYAGDLNGTIWRVDFNNSTPDVKYDDGLFTDPAGDPITATPALAAHPEGGLMVYTGTGKLIEVDDRTDTSERTFWAIRDQDFAVNSLADLGRVDVSEGPSDPGVLPQLQVEAVDGFQPGGWYMPLTIGGDTDGERVLSKPRVVFGRVILATFEAADDNCIPGGIQRLYVVDALTGDGDLNLPGSTCGGICGGVVIGAGAPIAPPVLIKRPPPPDTDVVVDFPGHSDPENPSDPPTPPGTATGDPASWCSRFGVPLATLSGTVEFTPLGSICEGRQVWRQIR